LAVDATGVSHRVRFARALRETLLGLTVLLEQATALTAWTGWVLDYELDEKQRGRFTRKKEKAVTLVML
jgi:hypothetical protein